MDELLVDYRATLRYHPPRHHAGEPPPLAPRAEQLLRQMGVEADGDRATAVALLARRRAEVDECQRAWSGRLEDAYRDRVREEFGRYLDNRAHDSVLRAWVESRWELEAALAILRRQDRNPAWIENAWKLKKATKQPIRACREALAAVDGAYEEALARLGGPVLRRPTPRVFHRVVAGVVWQGQPVLMVARTDAAHDNLTIGGAERLMKDFYDADVSVVCRGPEGWRVLMGPHPWVASSDPARRLVVDADGRLLYLQVGRRTSILHELGEGRDAAEEVPPFDRLVAGAFGLLASGESFLRFRPRGGAWMDIPGPLAPRCHAVAVTPGKLWIGGGGRLGFHAQHGFVEVPLDREENILALVENGDDVVALGRTVVACGTVEGLHLTGTRVWERQLAVHAGEVWFGGTHEPLVWRDGPEEEKASTRSTFLRGRAGGNDINSPHVFGGGSALFAATQVQLFRREESGWRAEFLKPMKELLGTDVLWAGRDRQLS